jgi:hypothetical protein
MGGSAKAVGMNQAPHTAAVKYYFIDEQCHCGEIHRGFSFVSDDQARFNARKKVHTCTKPAKRTTKQEMKTDGVR